MALVDFVETIAGGMAKKEYVAAVALDFKKAFDCVDRKILFAKLEKYGVRGIALSWIKSYFENRTQVVKYNNSFSSIESITIGVPQGSILGPLFFLIFINDIVNTTRECKFFMFADDTNIVVKADSYDNLCKLTNKVLRIVSTWLLVNRIAVNTKKCTTISFGCESLSNIVLCGDKLSASKSFKYLGVVIDENLTFRNHAENVISKLNQSIGIFRKLTNLINDKTKILLYNSLFLSHINYCIVIYGHKYRSFIETFRIMQLRAISVLFKCSQRQALKVMKSYRLLNFEDLIKYNISIFMFKAFQKLLPAQIQNVFTRYKDVHSRNSINSLNFTVNRSLSKPTDDCLSIYGVKLWNSLSPNLKSATNLNLFKKDLKQSLLTQLL